MHHNSLVGTESAVVIWVPKADSIVESARSLCPTNSVPGIGAHITINYPFVVQDEKFEATIARLTDSVKEFGAFEFQLTELMRWPTTLYLKPEPGSVFRAIIAAIWAAFPESPPYGGKFSDVVPHLTIVETDNTNEMDALEPRMRLEFAGQSPIVAHARALHLISRVESEWNTVACISLST